MSALDFNTNHPISPFLKLMVDADVGRDGAVPVDNGNDLPLALRDADVLGKQREEGVALASEEVGGEDGDQLGAPLRYQFHHSLVFKSST